MSKPNPNKIVTTVETPKVTSYYLRKCPDNMWQAMRIKGDKHEPLHVEDTLAIAMNTLMNTAKNDVVPK